MEEKSIRERVLALIAAIMDVETTDIMDQCPEGSGRKVEDLDLINEIGMEHIWILKLAEDLRGEFGCVINDEHVDGWFTIGQVIEYVEAQI